MKTIKRNPKFLFRLFSIFCYAFPFLSASAFAAEFEHSTYLKASNAAAHAQFGSSVAIDGNLAVVGAPDESSSASGVNGLIGASPITNSGAAYVFLRTGVEWNQIAHLKASNPVAHTQFGVTVTVSGSLIAIGHSFETGGGRVHIYRLENGGVAHEATLAASNAESGDSFGSSVSLSGQSLLVGAPSEDSSSLGINGTQTNNSAGSSGAAYVFQRSGNSWTQEAYVKASNTQSGDGFGNSVAIDGNTFVVGASAEDGGSTGINGLQSDNSKSVSGAAYVFFKSGGIWSQQSYLKASNTDADDSFGRSVAIDGDQILIGASGEDSSAIGVHGNQLDNSKSSSGAAYLFGRAGSTWTQNAYLKTSSQTNNYSKVQFFGMNVAIRGNLAVVAAEDNLPAIFKNNGNSWMALQPFQLPDVANPQSFGEAVAVSGITVLIGDRWERSSSNVINGNIGDSSAPSAGSAHLFTPPLLEATSVRNVAASLTPIPPNGLASKHFQLAWQAILGNRYDLLRSPNLVDWQSYPGFPAASTGTQEIIGTAPREFYKVVDIDAAPPERILTMFPAPGSFAVPRFADIRLELSDAAKIVPSSLKLTLGSAGPFTLANSPQMTFVNGVLRYDVIDTALGAIGTEVSAELVIADTDGYLTTYRWKFDLEKQPILAADLFVFGSATAQRAGQRFDAAQRAVAAATVGNVRLPSNGGNTWTLTAVNPNSITLTYTGAAPTQFHAGQFLANSAPSNESQIFYRKATAVSDNSAAKTLTISTVDVAMTDIVQQGSASISDRSIFFQPDALGNLIPTKTEADAARWDFGIHEENGTGTHVGAAGGISFSFDKFEYMVTPSGFISYDIADWTLNRFHASASARLDVEIVPRAVFYAETYTEGNATLVPQKTLKTALLGFIGILPVWLDVDFSMVARWGGQLAASGAISAGFQKTWEVKTSVDYKAGMSRPQFEPPRLTQTPLSVDGPDVTTETNASAWIQVEPRFDFLVQSMVGVYLSIDPKVENAATIRRENGVIVSKGFNGKAEGFLNFGLSVEGTDAEDGEWKLDRPLFSYPWCRDWKPETGWGSCCIGCGDPGSGDGDGSDTSG